MAVSVIGMLHGMVFVAYLELIIKVNATLVKIKKAGKQNTRNGWFEVTFSA
jgi:hypothetical protein